MDFYSWKWEEVQSSANLINDHFIAIPINWTFQERGWVRWVFFLFLFYEGSTWLSHISAWNRWLSSPGITSVGAELYNEGHSCAFSQCNEIQKDLISLVWLHLSQIYMIELSEPVREVLLRKMKSSLTVGSTKSVCTQGCSWPSGFPNWGSQYAIESVGFP